jgi:hypothetical protein
LVTVSDYRIIIIVLLVSVINKRCLRIARKNVIEIQSRQRNTRQIRILGGHEGVIAPLDKTTLIGM